MIIWDELPNADVVDICTAHELLCNVMGSPTSVPFGGKPVLGLGDFRQIAPVVPGGCQAEIEAASIKSDKNLWKKALVHKLTQQIRAAEDQQHANFVRRIGNGSEKVVDTILHGEYHSRISPLLRSYKTYFDPEEACTCVWTPQVKSISQNQKQSTTFCAGAARHCPQPRSSTATASACRAVHSYP